MLEVTTCSNKVLTDAVDARELSQDAKPFRSGEVPCREVRISCAFPETASLIMRAHPTP